MAKSEDRIVPMLRDAGVLDMPLVERSRWMVAELGRRFNAEHAFEGIATIERADALIGRLVLCDFERRIEILESKVRELEASR